MMRLHGSPSKNYRRHNSVLVEGECGMRVMAHLRTTWHCVHSEDTMRYAIFVSVTFSHPSCDSLAATSQNTCSHCKRKATFPEHHSFTCQVENGLMLICIWSVVCWYLLFVMCSKTVEIVALLFVPTCFLGASCDRGRSTSFVHSLAQTQTPSVRSQLRAAAHRLPHHHHYIPYTHKRFLIHARRHATQQ